MRRSDLALAVLALLAAGATVAGALRGDDWAGERTYRFAAGEQALPPQGPAPAGGAGARFNWTVPDNATGAALAVALAFDGQAVRGGPATVTVRVTGPDGRSQPPVTRAWPIAQGATSGALQVNATASWAEAPGELRDAAGASHATRWGRPLEVHVLVEAPSDLPLASYSFTATVQGSVARYAAA